MEKERVGSIPVSDLCQRAGVKKEFGVDVCVLVCVCLSVCLVVEEENRVVYFLP